MTFAKCPSCGVLYAAKKATANIPCDRCRALGYFSRLKWEAPRRNKYDKNQR